MQITFDPKKLDLAEASVVLGMVMPALVKGCREQGDDLTQIQASLRDLLDQTWAAVTEARKDG